MLISSLSFFDGADKQKGRQAKQEGNGRCRAGRHMSLEDWIPGLQKVMSVFELLLYLRLSLVLSSIITHLRTNKTESQWGEVDGTMAGLSTVWFQCPCLTLHWFFYQQSGDYLHQAYLEHLLAMQIPCSRPVLIQQAIYAQGRQLSSIPHAKVEDGWVIIYYPDRTLDKSLFPLGPHLPYL